MTLDEFENKLRKMLQEEVVPLTKANEKLREENSKLREALSACEEAIRCRENTMGGPCRLLEVQDMGRRAAKASSGYSPRREVKFYKALTIRQV